MTERREFQMDKNLLVDVIKRQAGSLQKAVLEGVMNSIEAGATAKTGGVQVTLDAKQLIISDGGRGFRNRQEIEDWFETFGKPHEASEGKVWAQFRMGRGQLMAFGRNLWNSNQFQMDVDIDGKGLGYDLSEVKKFDGCRVQVDLYRPLDDSEIWSTSREIERAVKFVEIPVFVNGKQVNTPASEGKWDTRGHRDRIVHVDHEALSAIHALTEDAETPLEEARFLQPYSAKMLEVFRAMAAAPSE